MSLQSAIITVMVSAAQKASRRLLRDFGEVENLQVSRKGPDDFVSTAEQKAEQQLVYELAKARPEYGFLLAGQSTREGNDKSQRFIVGPLNGRANFLHGIPHFSISIAHEKDGVIVAGIVHDPVLDEMFWAERNRGAWINNRRLRVSGRGELTQSVLVAGSPQTGPEGDSEYLGMNAEMTHQSVGLRRLGAAALDLAYVAAGRCEGYWSCGLHPWDIAASSLLVREAGGFVTDYAGRDKALYSGEVLAANDKLHQPLSDLLIKNRHAAKAENKTV